MPPLPTRETLEGMKRADLQKLCKDYGVKANLKSEALIDLLLDTQTPPQAPQMSRRSVSTRQSSRAGPSRTSSIIIHDTDEGKDEDEEDAIPQPWPEKDPSPQPIPLPRTRKGKEQVRLGVGRPVAAGGAGPRAVTKSMSVTRSRRTNPSKSLKRTEETIEEEPEISTEHEMVGTEAKLNHPNERPANQMSNFKDKQLLSLSDIDKHVADALRPLYEQIETLKLELKQMYALKTELAQVKTQIVIMGDLKKRVESLAAEVEDLQTQHISLSTQWGNMSSGLSVLTSGKPVRPGGLGLPSKFKESRGSVSLQDTDSQDIIVTKSTLPLPGLTTSLLGKRHRDSNSSNITGVVEEDEQDDLSDEDLARKVVRPTKKRLKIGELTPPEQQEPLQSDVSLHHSPVTDKLQTPRAPSFTVFQGPENTSDFLDSAPPTMQLPDYFAPPSPTDGNTAGSSSGHGAMTSSAAASENQNPFNFSFAPISSTPANTMYMPSFPYPEPPQSPSPAGLNPTGFMNTHSDERTDIFKTFGMPSPTRRARSLAPSEIQEEISDQPEFVNPAALTRGLPGKQRQPPNGVRMSSEPEASAGSDSNSLSVKRTMYGTELDSDSRFGDFGMEGVATGFWAGGRH